ncbi:hypothetical protein [Dokdonella sp.]|uniref:hypothetical protein n=1 Tax=Dokdonella sp. TaxID=2291710 RepID=UPI003784D643
MRPIRDPAFGGRNDGIARIRISADDTARDTARAAVALPDGRLVLGGMTQAAERIRFQFARLKGDGSPDATFGQEGNGAFVLDVEDISAMTHMLAPDEHTLLFAGTTLESTGIIGKVDDHGVLDKTFGEAGLRFVDASLFIDAGTLYTPMRLVPLRSNKTLVVGFAFSSLSACAALLRLTETGELDTTFGNDGAACLAPQRDNQQWALGTGAVETADGTLYLTGAAYHQGGNGFDMFVARLTADGRLDTQFGNEGSGFAFANFDSGGDLHDIAHDIAIDDGNRIVIAGSVAAPSNGNDFDMGIARLLPDGSLDPSFANEGRLQFSVSLDGSSTDAAQDIELIEGNRLLIGGWSKERQQIATLLMLDERGRLDPRFGTGGVFQQAATSAPDDDVIAVVPHNLLRAGDHIYLFGSVPVGDPLPDSSRPWAFAATRYVLPLFDDGFDEVPSPTPAQP